MRDFFALLAQPRQPWLESNVLKEKHHELTRRAHPDVRGNSFPGNFEEINEAYQILSEPKLRIRHLLQLEGRANPKGDRPVPSDLQELFLQVGIFSQTMQRVLATISSSSALARSLAKGELLQLERQTAQLLEKISRSYDACLTELRSVNEIWKTKKEDAVNQLQHLHDRMAYLSRWIAQLKEMQFQLTLR